MAIQNVWRMLLLAALGVSGALSAQAIEIAADRERVSIVANNVPIRDVASRLADATGIPVSITGDAETRVTVNVSDEPLEKAVARLSSNYLLVHEHESAGSPVIEVVLLLDDASNGSVSTEQFLPSGEPAEDSEAVQQLDADTSITDDESDPPLLDDEIDPSSTLEGEGLEAGPQ